MVKPRNRYSHHDIAVRGCSWHIPAREIQLTIISQPAFIARLKQYLSPPGEGVFTVHTAGDKRRRLQEKIFGAVAVAENRVRSCWEHALDHDLPGAPCVIFGIASDCGGGIQRGANWGPLFLRETLLGAHPELRAFDIGDARVIPHLLHDKYLNTETLRNCRRALYGDEASDFPVSPLSIAEDFAPMVKAPGIIQPEPETTLASACAIANTLIRLLTEANAAERRLPMTS